MDKKEEKIYISKSGRKYTRSNASPVVRKVHVTQTGKKICLVGRNRFEWTVIESCDYTVNRATTFKGRQEALDYYRLLIRNHKVKTCCNY